jgi:predicted acyltransferase (DUF342 family)
MKLIKKQLVTAILASTFSLGAHAVGINFDGGQKAAGSPVDEHCNDVTLNTGAPGGTYVCSADVSSDKYDVYIASHYLVSMTRSGDVETLSAASAILGANGRLVGNLNSASTVALGANAEITGNVTSVTTVALGAGAKVTRAGTSTGPCGKVAEANSSNPVKPQINELSDGTIQVGGSMVPEDCTIAAGSTLALGADAVVTGNVKAFTTIAVGAGGRVNGSVVAGTTVALGANSSAGNVIAGTTVALGAESFVGGDVTSIGSTVTLGVDAYITGTTTAMIGAVTLGAGAYTCENVAAYSAATLGADSFVRGKLDAVTSTVAAGAFVTGTIKGTTVTVGAKGCFGDIVDYTTITLGAGAGYCGRDLDSSSIAGAEIEVKDTDFAINELDANNVALFNCPAT